MNALKRIAVCLMAAVYLAVLSSCDVLSYFKCKHSFGVWVNVTKATCETQGYDMRVCEFCSTAEFRFIEATGHLYTEYLSNNDASFEADGTMTAQCDHGCGKTDTTVDEGSRLRHYEFIVLNGEGTPVTSGYVQLCEVDENGNLGVCFMPIAIEQGKVVYTPVLTPGRYEVRVLDENCEPIELVEKVVTEVNDFGPYTLTLSSAKTELYRVKVQNPTGYPFYDVRISLWSGETYVKGVRTDESGYAELGAFIPEIFDGYQMQFYSISLSDGYEVGDIQKTYLTGDWTGFEISVTLNPTGVIKEPVPTGKEYALGDVMYDFSLTLSDGSTVTLSEMLEEKEVVMLHFWATWCGPAIIETSHVKEAYELYKNEVEIIGISITDSMQAVREYKEQNAINYPMTSGYEVNTSICTMFDTSAIPCTIMIDRYGVIVYCEVGAKDSVSFFTERFEKLLSDDYKSTILS